MKRKGGGGRPTLAESLAKRPVDEKQRKIIFNFGLGVRVTRVCVGVRACEPGRTCVCAWPYLLACVHGRICTVFWAFPLFLTMPITRRKVPRARTVGRFRRRLGVPVKVHALLFPTTPQRPCTSLVELRILRVARLICALVGDGS